MKKKVEEARSIKDKVRARCMLLQKENQDKEKELAALLAEK